MNNDQTSEAAKAECLALIALGKASQYGISSEDAMAESELAAWRCTRSTIYRGLDDASQMAYVKTSVKNAMMTRYRADKIFGSVSHLKSEQLRDRHDVLPANGPDPLRDCSDDEVFEHLATEIGALGAYVIVRKCLQGVSSDDIKSELPSVMDKISKHNGLAVSRQMVNGLVLSGLTTLRMRKEKK